jgi:hypothetical protein
MPAVIGFLSVLKTGRRKLLAAELAEGVGLGANPLCYFCVISMDEKVCRARF